MRLLPTLAFLLLLTSPAFAQFEVLDPAKVAVPNPAPAAPTVSASDYTWVIHSVAALRPTGEGETSLLVIESGTPRSAASDRAIGISHLVRANGKLSREGVRLLLDGALDTFELADLTGDGQPDLVLRRIRTLPGEEDRTQSVPRVVTTAYTFAADGSSTELLRYETPAGATECLGLLPTPAGTEDLIIASFGGHAAGSTASPDAYLHFSYTTDNTGPHLQRLTDLVLPPVPIAQMITADLTGNGAPLVVTSRDFPDHTYKQQLWAQRLNPQGFFDNAPIGQGNDLTLLAPDSRMPGILFLWRDNTATPPLTHLTSLRIDAAGKPKASGDLRIPLNLTLQDQAWGAILPGAPLELPGLALLLDSPDGGQWLALVRLTATGAFDGFELHQFDAVQHWSSVAAYDIDGDGVEELVGASGGSLMVFNADTRKLTGPIALPPDARTAQDSDVFTLEPDAPN